MKMLSVFFIFMAFLSVEAVVASEVVAPLVPLEEIERARKRLYPGGRDEEELKVMAELPDFQRKTDERVIQKEVHKALFNQELQDDAGEAGAADAGSEGM